MPFPRSQLTMVLCSNNPDWAPSAEVEARILDELENRGLAPFERLDEASTIWIKGGFRRLNLVKHERAQLIANHQGGYRVFCRHCRGLVTGGFVTAIKAYRAGGERELRCSKCNSLQDLNALVFQPPAAFACFEVQLHDVQDIELTELARAFFTVHIPELQLILKRQA